MILLKDKRFVQTMCSVAHEKVPVNLLIILFSIISPQPHCQVRQIQPIYPSNPEQPKSLIWAWLMKAWNCNNYGVSDNIDTILMTSAQYSGWQNGNTAHTESGSDYDDDSDDYVYYSECGYILHIAG